MLIGTMFRFSSADIVFTSDLINRRGLITPPNYPITEGTSLTPFLKRSLQCDFDCYLTEQEAQVARAKDDVVGIVHNGYFWAVFQIVLQGI